MYHHPWITIPLLRCVVQALFLLWKTRVTAEHIRGVVGGHDVVCGVIHPCQIWPMLYVPLIKYGIAYPYLCHHPWTTT